ncbi:MAG TPA: 3-isopropylmalate dehydratase large subunit [Rhodospirillaceae bacterium]|nr:3-isopropylmalate dehydratase large subunit [Rhodospirillaceae bacterium]HAT35120.1 3-isopropylmalate dehydratase large subunit [Rhodospirillaceae bacterium]
MTETAPGKTLFDKIWDSHVVTEVDGETLVYVDRLLLHEGSRHSFTNLKDLGMEQPFRAEQVFAFSDHYVPTHTRKGGIPGVKMKDIRGMLELMETNAADTGVRLFGWHDENQGILHVVPPEQGITQPGFFICGADSHTSTHGAFGNIAFGVGSSEAAHIMATQCLWQQRPKTFRINVEGDLPFGVHSKDIILGVIADIGVGGGVGHAIEFAGSCIEGLTMEQRMTVCNMTIEAAGRMGLIAPDETTYEYMDERPYMPKGALLQEALAYWKSLPSDEDAEFDKETTLDADALIPMVTWGTNPEMCLPITGTIPSPNDAESDEERQELAAAIDYMELTPGMGMEEIEIERVFIGSCTNSRIEDLRAAAEVAAKGTAKVLTWVVPGSKSIKRQAEAEGLDKIFTEAGFEWREPGCSLCTAINGDLLNDGERCVSTSNRNFKGRQGPNGKTHLASPAMAAAAAITGKLTDVRSLD